MTRRTRFSRILRLDELIKQKTIHENVSPPKIDLFEDKEYWKLLDNFCSIYKTNKFNVVENPKEEYRYFCYRYLDYIRQIELPSVERNKKYETVIIEYRIFPHLEFLIRNMIIKTGSEWSHTIVCGMLNYEFCVYLVNKIGVDIKIIKTDLDDLNQSSYSILLANKEFWSHFNGEKILIYQEDTCLFRDNIKEFLEWDYIGASWPNQQNDNANGVGNGGFSLRTKQCMLDVIDKISLEDTKFNSSTINYMNATNMTIGPEDVYFSLNMIEYNIGRVAPRNIADLFSSETNYHPQSLGGHNFWISNKNWKQLLYNRIVRQFQPMFVNDTEHRGGWISIMKHMENNDFFNKNSDLVFYDVIERYFLWEKDHCCTKNWTGILHSTIECPYYIDKADLKNLLDNQNFIKSLRFCKGIYCLSNHVSNYVNKRLEDLNCKTPIYTLTHPIHNENYMEFEFDKFLQNPHKKLLQVGQQLRKMTSIYLVDIPPNFEKMWLTGTKNFNKCSDLLLKECNYLNVQINKNQVEMKYTSIKDYDQLLACNIVMIHLFDASANNTVLECIIRNTPIIVNRLPAVIEYLGENYPLYFESLSQVSELLSVEMLRAGHVYLQNLDKTKLNINNFVNDIYPTLIE